MDPFLAKLPIDLRSKIVGVVNIVPQSLQVFEELYRYAEDSEVSRKRIKPENQDANVKLDLNSPEKSQIIFKLEEVSVLFPLRKKMDMVLYLSPDTKKPVLTLIREAKREISVDNLSENIAMATFLPVAEKENKLYLFIKYDHSMEGKYSDPILITLSKDILLTQFKKFGVLSSEVEDFTKCIEYMRKQAILAGFRISDPFFSNPQANGDNCSFHVECHRGTKEGTLYFLPDHIIFGFKKPILKFDSSDIESITYSSITRLTFNVTMVTKDEQKYEFSMIDQNEYTKIDDYVKRKQVKDKSMSEELKAKSKSKTAQASNENAPSALEEATQQMKNESNINGVGMNSDNEDDDENFEADSDLSDGSGSDGESAGEEEDVESGAQIENFEVDDEDNDEDSEEDDDDDQNTGPGDAELEQPEQFPQKDEFSLSLGLQDIPIELDDDEEGSGVEY